MKTKEEIEIEIKSIEKLISFLVKRTDGAFDSLIRQKKGEIQALRWALGERESLALNIKVE